MTYLKEFFYHYYNILCYRRKEHTVIENQHIKINKFIDSYYVKNKNVFILFCNDNCVNNLYNYAVGDKRINIYIIRVKQYSDEQINRAIELIKNVHHGENIQYVFIHGFVLTKQLLKNKDIFQNNHYHVCITPLFRRLPTNMWISNYFKQFDGENLEKLKFEDIRLQPYHKNMHIIFNNNILFIREKEVIDNNVTISYCNTDSYLCYHSLEIAKTIINRKMYMSTVKLLA